MKIEERKRSVSKVKSRKASPGVVVIEYINQIASAWQKSVHAILDTARLCGEADTKLSAKEVVQLQAELPFSTSTYSKLLQISKCKRLYDPKIMPRLPASFSSLYELTLLANEKFDEALKDGVINTEVTRAEVTHVRKNDNVPGAATLPSQFFAGLVLDPNISIADTNAFLIKLDKLCSEFRASVIGPKERRDAEIAKLEKACARWEKAAAVCDLKVNRFKIRAVNQKISEHKAKYRRLNRKYPFDEDGFQFSPRDSALDEKLTLALEEVADGDELPEITEAARKAFPYPDGPALPPWLKEEMFASAAIETSAAKDFLGTLKGRRRNLSGLNLVNQMKSQVVGADASEPQAPYIET